MTTLRHTPGTYLTDAELCGLVVAVGRSVAVLGTSAPWSTRVFFLALSAEMAWRGLTEG